MTGTPRLFTDGPIPHGYGAPLTAVDLNAIYERELHADIAWARVERRKRELNITLAWDIVIIIALAYIAYAAMAFWAFGS